jgi:peptidoglycan hydrolase-like protein with peptidoglycan-binding domain
MAQIDATLALAAPPYVPAPPIASGIATSDPACDTKWVQSTLNTLGFWPELEVDGSYGFWTKLTVDRFQFDYGLQVDGIVGPATTAALKKAVQLFQAEKK